MTVLLTPASNPDQQWPTLGQQVCKFITDNLVFGPGDLRGQPARLDPEKRAFIQRMYEVYPADHPEVLAENTNAGRRRFKRVGLSLSKGQAKTELAAWLAACELHPDAPVRCDPARPFDADGRPRGIGVTDPYIPIVAYTEEQTTELAYATLRVVLEEGPLASSFDIGMERITRIRGDGRAVPLSAAPSARDGARTTFQIADETHHWTTPRLKKAHQTMMLNLPKRLIADAWALEVTTAPEPGAGSVAEDMMEYARAITEHRAKDSHLFYFHREASDKHDLTTDEGAMAALVEASGPTASWRDLRFVVGLFGDPTTDKSYLERVWCNRMVKASAKAFDPVQWAALYHPDYSIPDGALITLGFDGAIFRDGTGLVATEVETGFQEVLGIWEQPYGETGEGWQVPEAEVDDLVVATFQRYDVWRMYADPPYWQSWISKWAGEFGEDKVVQWHTIRRTPMTRALENYQTAQQTGELHHDGNAVMARHITNSLRHDLPITDDEGLPLFLIRKERQHSPNKIDLAMAGVLSWEAAKDAIASGAVTEGGPSMYETEELFVL